MKKFLLTILSLTTASHFVSAQITIDASDSPQIGQTYYYDHASPTTLPTPVDGINQIWDYTASQTNAKRDTILIVTPPDDRQDQFAKSNVMMRFSSQNYDEYLISSSQSLAVNGVDFHGTFPEIDYDPYEKPFTFPLYYGGGIAQSESGYTYITGGKRYTYSSQNTSEVIGWGKLKIASGTFDALLLETIHIETKLYGSNPSTMDTATTYLFVGKGDLFLGSYTPNQKSRASNFSSYAGGINISTGLNDAVIASGALNVTYSETTKNINISQPDESATLVLSDVNGNVITTEKITETHTELLIPALHEGFYIYSLNTSGNKSSRGKILIR